MQLLNLIKIKFVVFIANTTHTYLHAKKQLLSSPRGQVLFTNRYVPVLSKLLEEKRNILNKKIPANVFCLETTWRVIGFCTSTPI